jgi:hypothetical protein
VETCKTKKKKISEEMAFFVCFTHTLFWTRGWQVTHSCVATSMHAHDSGHFKSKQKAAKNSKKKAALVIIGCVFALPVFCLFFLP